MTSHRLPGPRMQHPVWPPDTQVGGGGIVGGGVVGAEMKERKHMI